MIDNRSDEAADWGPLSGLPGNPMMWILILGELAVFGAFLLGFAIAHARNPVLFGAGQGHLDRMAAGLNTLVLITSGWMVAVAVAQRHAGKSGRAALVAGMVLGLVFLGIKAHEYLGLFEAGFGIESDTFFRLYFMITGFHALHIVMGLTILGIVFVANTPENMETGAAFWHMLDMIWVLIYPLVYLLRLP